MQLLVIRALDQAMRDAIALGKKDAKKLLNPSSYTSRKSVSTARRELLRWVNDGAQLTLWCHAVGEDPDEYRKYILEALNEKPKNKPDQGNAGRKYPMQRSN